MYVCPVSKNSNYSETKRVRTFCYKITFLYCVNPKRFYYCGFGLEAEAAEAEAKQDFKRPFKVEGGLVSKIFIK
jgi:hypothetical protein